MPLGPLRRLLALIHRRPGRALAVYWPIAFIGTHLPRFGPLRSPPRHGFPFDKIAHAVGYAILAWLLMLALQRLMRPAVAITIVVLVTAAYGVFDELTQPLVNRTADIWDFLANLVGCALGIAVALQRRKAAAPGE